MRAKWKRGEIMVRPAAFEILEGRLLLSGQPLTGPPPAPGSAPAVTLDSSGVFPPAPADKPLSQRELRQSARLASRATATFFDDFTYDSPADSALSLSGWQIRPASEDGPPGPAGATWSPDGVSFVTDPDDGGNRLMTLTARTDGSAAGSQQVEVHSAEQFGEGTYIARVWLAAQADYGPSADQVNQAALFAISSDSQRPYTECDFEYLPLGGWGQPSASMFITTWRTQKRSNERAVPGSLSGWHTLAFQVTPRRVTYYVDGAVDAVQSRRGRVTPMAIAFNMWFLPQGLGQSALPRGYSMDIDWIYFSTSLSLSPAAAAAAVADLQAQGLPRQDTLPVAL